MPDDDPCISVFTPTHFPGDTVPDGEQGYHGLTDTLSAWMDRTGTGNTRMIYYLTRCLAELQFALSTNRESRLGSLEADSEADAF